METEMLAPALPPEASAEEYELIDIEFELKYEDVTMPSLRVCEDGVEDTGGKTPEFEYDEDGIPLGHSKTVIKMR